MVSKALPACGGTFKVVTKTLISSKRRSPMPAPIIDWLRARIKEIHAGVKAASFDMPEAPFAWAERLPEVELLMLGVSSLRPPCRRPLAGARGLPVLGA